MFIANLIENTNRTIHKKRGSQYITWFTSTSTKTSSRRIQRTTHTLSKVCFLKINKQKPINFQNKRNLVLFFFPIKYFYIQKKMNL